MKKTILILFFLINLFFIINYLINFESPINMFWVIFFVIGAVLSVTIMYRSPKNPNYILAVAVLATSVSALGAFGFHYFLSNLMG